MTNRIQEAFDQIEASEALKSSTLRFLQMERERRNRRVFLFGWERAVAVACAALVLCLGGGFYTVKTPVSYISIDVNPSIELSINRFDRVVDTAFYNEEGEALLTDVQVMGLRYTEAIDAIVESEALQPYLGKKASLSFTVAAGDSEKRAAILTGIEECSGARKHHGQSYEADISSIPDAHESGLSFGKYAAYLALSQYDSTVTTEDCRGMSMGEIHQQIDSHERNGGVNESNHEIVHPGFSHGHGHGN